MSRRFDHRLSQRSLDALQALVGRRARFGMAGGAVFLGAQGTIVGAQGVVVEHWDSTLTGRPARGDIALAWLSAQWSRSDDAAGPARFVALPRLPVGLKARLSGRDGAPAGGLTQLLVASGARRIASVQVHVGEVWHEEWDDARFGLRKQRSRQDRRVVFALEEDAAIAFEPFDGVQAGRLMAMNGGQRPPGRAGEELRLRLTLH